jgi:hypothetical protein
MPRLGAEQEVSCYRYFDNNPGLELPRELAALDLAMDKMYAGLDVPPPLLDDPDPRLQVWGSFARVLLGFCHTFARILLGFCRLLVWWAPVVLQLWALHLCS